jgi:hypothetical protein
LNLNSFAQAQFLQGSIFQETFAVIRDLIVELQYFRDLFASNLHATPHKDPKTASFYLHGVVVACCDAKQKTP